MGALQASSLNIRRMAGVPKLSVKIRRERPRGLDSRASKLANPGRTDAPLVKSSESAMVQQAIAGNIEAQEQLFASRKGRLFRTAFAVLRNREDAEDALQDGLFSAYSKMKSFEGRSSFSSWLTRIVINAALMLRRRRNSHPEASMDEILDSLPERYPSGAVDPRSDPEKIYAANEIKGLVERQIRKLPSELQQEYRLRVINSLSAAESGRVLGIPPSLSKSRLFHARRKLTNALRESA
jgi:RNA polymerase sigma-70 factor (ECF subfamily)